VFGVDRLGVADILDVARYARAFGATHLHSHAKRAALVAWGAARLTGLPRLHTFHGLHPERHFGWRRRLYLAGERALARGRAATIHVSESQARFAERLGIDHEWWTIHGGIPWTQVESVTRHRSSWTIPNGVDADWAQAALGRALGPILGLPDGLPVVVAVGRFDDPVKGLDVLLRASSLSGAFRLLLIGQLPSAWRDISRVTTIGEVAEPLNWFSAAEVFVSASWAEGLPYSMLDAMAAGLPVVATRVRGHVDLVVDGTTGRLVNPGDAGALARAIERMLADPDRKAWGERGAARVRVRFRLEDMAHRTAEVYEEVR
ncbi:MAG: glycosyltransferase, partial [Dehalococcoidia bacterium]|nr:glycosyltransferase [Dehalococcoidia bacterium]